jgi:GxxExxY protein
VTAKGQERSPVERQGHQEQTGKLQTTGDIVVHAELVLTIKTARGVWESAHGVTPIHESQLLTYRKLSGHRLGFLVNWNVPLIKDGIKRMVNGL